MDKQAVIEKLREMADALESGRGDLTTREVTLSGDARYEELKVGVLHNDQLQSADNHTENTMDRPPSSFRVEDGGLKTFGEEYLNEVLELIEEPKARVFGRNVLNIDWPPDKTPDIEKIIYNGDEYMKKEDSHTP